MNIFDVLCYLSGLLGLFDPQYGYNLQRWFWIVADWLGYTVHIAVG